MSFLGKLFSLLGNSRDDDSDNTYNDYICPYCKFEWRIEGNGGLVLGCWPNCPKCGTMADEKDEQNGKD